VYVPPPQPYQPQPCGPVRAEGCANGVRFGFKDVGFYPDIAACVGMWTVPGLYTPGPPGAPTASNLCAPGWHICQTAAEVAQRTRGRGCADAVTCPGEYAFYATLQSGPGYAQCAAQGTNDVFGCGNLGARPAASCAPLDRFSHNNCSALPQPWSCYGETQELMTVTKNGMGGGGVLCCR
jgi:hypothetical protein